jgi:hypothetical protein
MVPGIPRPVVLPGVFFVYDLSPFMVTVTQRRGEGILAFLAGLCAILGGVLTCSELLDRFVHRRTTLVQSVLRVLSNGASPYAVAATGGLMARPSSGAKQA